MEAPIIVAGISAFAAILGAILTFYLTKRKEREAEWRKHKLEHYKELLDAMNETLAPVLTEDARVRFCRASNNIFLVGSPQVLVTLRSLLDETSDSNPCRSQKRHDELLTALMFAIRDDIGIKPNKPRENYTFSLRSGHLRK